MPVYPLHLLIHTVCYREKEEDLNRRYELLNRELRPILSLQGILLSTLVFETQNRLKIMFLAIVYRHKLVY